MAIWPVTTANSRSAQSIYAFATISRTSALSNVTPGERWGQSLGRCTSGVLRLEHDHRSTVASVFGSSPVAGDEALHLRDPRHNRLSQLFLRVLHVADRDLHGTACNGLLQLGDRDVPEPRTWCTSTQARQNSAGCTSPSPPGRLNLCVPTKGRNGSARVRTTLAPAAFERATRVRRPPFSHP